MAARRYEISLRKLKNIFQIQIYKLADELRVELGTCGRANSI